MTNDKVLLKYWRLAVRAKWYDACGLCGRSDQPLDCHHIIRRGVVLTRWDVANGIPLCIPCHAKAHTAEGKADVILIGMVDYPYLMQQAQKNYKDYLLERGMVEAEFRERELVQLKRFIDVYELL